MEVLTLYGHVAEQAKKKISEFNKGKWTGEKNPRWRGGVDNKSAEYVRMLYKKNPYPRRFSNMRRHKRNKKAGSLTVELIQTVYEENIKQNGTLTCIYCNKKIPFGKDSLEHKLPLSRGGKNIFSNLAIACKSCNCHKHNKTEEEYKMFLLAQGGASL